MDHSSIQRYREAEKRLWNYYGAQPKEDFFFLERPRLRIRTQELGKGPPLLFLHGNPAAGAIWVPLAVKLTDYRCLLLDVPGHGLSDPLDYDSSNLQGQIVALIDAVVDGLGYDQISLVASSGGGAMAYWYALTRPEKVGQIIQLGTPAQLEGSPIDAFTRLLTIPRLNRLLLRLMPLNLKSMRSMYAQIGHGPAIEDGRIPTCFLEWALHLTADTQTMAATLDLTEAGMTWRGIRADALIGREDLANITQPTQYIWSEDDPFGGAALARATAKRTPDSALHLLPGSGHLPWLDAPDEVAGLMRSFLHTYQTHAVAADDERMIA